MTWHSLSAQYRYLTYFFALSGFTNAFAIVIISNACSIAGGLSAIFTIRLFGRRTILICGALVNAFSMLAFAIVSLADPGSVAAARCLIAFICIFTFSYAASWGSIVPVVVGEVSSNRLRTKSIAFAMSGNWATSMLVICGAPYLINPAYANIGPKVGFIFGGLAVPLAIFTYFCVPETKDRTLEEIDEMFLNVRLGIIVAFFFSYLHALQDIPALKFKNYVCTGNVRGSSAEKMGGVSFSEV